jgi:glycosyltransferase involved in cell wall biosynthesis
VRQAGGDLEDWVAVRVAVTLEQCWHRVPGGTAVAAIELVRALRERGEVSVIGVAAKHLRPPPGAFAPQVAVRHLPLPRRALYETWHRLRWPAVQRATGPVDVIHATGIALPPRIAPLVLTLHDLVWRRYPEAFTRNGLRFFDTAVALAQRDADVVLCSSDATRRDAEAAGFDPARLAVVPLGVRSRPAGDAEVAAVRARFGLAGPYVLAVGTREPRKNLGSLVRAVAALGRSDLTLVVVGPAGWQQEEGALLAPLEGRVRVTGFVPEAERNALMKGAAAFCYPALFEGFGLPVLEALAQGAPVVTSAGTSTEEVAGRAAVLVDPTSVASIGAGLAEVLDDPARAEELRLAGPARAAQFPWDATAAAVEAAYRRAAGERAAVAGPGPLRPRTGPAR